MPTINLSSTQVTNIGRGGTALQPANVADSITTSGGNLQLVGDSATPGNSYFYGTNGSGVRGWYALSTLPQGTVTSITSSTLTVAGTSAVPTINLSSTQVTNIGRGGTALQAVNVADSITTNGGNLILVNDSATPGNSYFYGTNGAGTKGWYALSAITTVTNLAGGTANQIPYQTGVGATSFYSPANYGVQIYGATGVPASIAGAAGVLQGSASAIPAFTTTPTLTGTNFSGTAASLTVGNATAAVTATKLAGGLAGSIPYQTAAGATSMLAIGTAGYYLTVNAGATAPQWSALPAYPTGANPTASVGLTAVNGSAATFMRSDGAPALSVSNLPHLDW